MTTPGTAGGPGELMAAEIAEQPTVLARAFHQSRPQVRAVAARLQKAGPRFVVLAGRGSSDHAALYGKYLIETGLGLPCGLASLSTLTGYDAEPELSDVLWIAVSQSGSSPDLVESTQKAARAGALTLALTNRPESPLASAAELHIDVGAGPELSVAATKTYTAQLQALWLLIDAVRGGNGDAARAVPDAVAEVLEADAVSGLRDRFRYVERLITVGRGFSYPTARESALKLMETSYLAAHAFSGADLMHGPLAMVDQDGPVVVVAPRGIAGRLLVPVLSALRERRADVVVVGDPALAHEHRARVCVPVPSRVEGALSSLVEIVPLQRLALELALDRRLDPDHPRGLSKVTETT
ncbi:MAG: SIS domain-containing protein [Nocardioidaceae bacterium]